jgi:hypothetical protein
MSARTFIDLVNAYWQKRLVRILLALLVIGGAIYLQYRLANIPLPVDVEKSKPPYTPATAALIKREELVVDTPAVDNSSGQTPAGVFLSGDGTDFVSVEARFDSAQLGNDFMDLLRTDTQDKSLPKQDRELIVYTAIADEEAEASPSQAEPSPEKQKAAPCRTSIDVKLPQGGKPLTELHFFQIVPGSDRHRNFEMRAIDADLIVQLQTRNFTDTLGEMQGADCGKTLAVGKWKRSFTAPAPIDIVVPAGSSFRFSFTSAEGKTPWSRSGNSYEPFKLVAVPVSARAVREVKRETSPASVSTRTTFEARSADSGQLVLKYLRVGSEELQLDFAGNAMVQEDGKYAVTFSLLEFAKASPILAGILAMFDAALLEWIRRALFKGNKGVDKTKN